MIPALLYIWILFGFVALAPLEVAIEGRHPWASASPGWRRWIFGRFELTAYHLWLFVMILFFVTLPIITLGFHRTVICIIISAAAFGFVLEDYLWFIINPSFPLSRWNSIEVDWYPWLRIGRVEIPVGYVVGLVIALGAAILA